MRRALLALLTLPAIAWNTAEAEVTSTVVDIEGASGRVRYLHVTPTAPVAHVISLPGGSNTYGIADDGRMIGVEARCSPWARNRQPFAERGVSLALMNNANADVLAVVRALRARHPVPVWVAGGSSSTGIAANAVVRLPPDEPAGLLLGAPQDLPDSLAAAIRTPTFVVYHMNDAFQAAQALYPKLTGAAAREILGMTGGTNADCGFHLLEGLDGEFMTATTGFMQRHASLLGSSAPGAAEATAVEFYNAGLDHYFLTHVAGEIAKLDAGIDIRGWTRTGQSFKVFAAPTSGTSAVCRFYIPPDKGDSHFYGRGQAECDATAAANPTFVNEDPQFFHVRLPVAGACPAGTRNVYRVFSNRSDANHRYMADASMRDQMVGRGWTAEGDGPDLVVMCVPQ